MDKPGLPIDLVILVIVVMPCCLAVFFGLFAFRGMTPLVFRCLRCGGEFRRKPWQRFAERCPLCRASRWNLPE